MREVPVFLSLRDHRHKVRNVREIYQLLVKVFWIKVAKRLNESRREIKAHSLSDIYLEQLTLKFKGYPQ